MMTEKKEVVVGDAREGACRKSTRLLDEGGDVAVSEVAKPVTKKARYKDTTHMYMVSKLVHTTNCIKPTTLMTIDTMRTNNRKKEKERKRRKKAGKKEENRGPSMPSSRSFFKVILVPNSEDNKLRIPDIFVKNYGDELSDFIRLIVPTGDTWCVRVDKRDQKLWLRDGLQKFIDDHSVRYGSFLIFDYVGNSTFNIRIFDPTAMEIQYLGGTKSAGHVEKDQLPIPYKEEDDDSHRDDEDSSIVYLGSSADHQLLEKSLETSKFVSDNQRTSVASAKRYKLNCCYLTRSKKQTIQGEGGKRTTNIPDFMMPEIDDQSNRTIQKSTADKETPVSPKKASGRITSITNRKKSSRKCQSVGTRTTPEVSSENGQVEVQVNKATETAKMMLLKNPLYKVALKPYNLNKNLVNLPSGFGRLYLSGTSMSIKILDADDNEWKVQCNTHGHKGCSLSKGWKQFVEGNNLMVGDVCFFEPIRINEEVKLKVRISRAM